MAVLSQQGVITMRDLIYYVAATVDGFIAHPDGSFDGFPWNDEYGADLSTLFPETIPAHLRPADYRHPGNAWFDVVLMGRNTYEVGLKEGFSNPYPTLQQYVFSHTMHQSPDPQVTLVRDNAVEMVRTLKHERGKAMWLCGGATLATTLFAADLIDHLIVKLNPVLFGAGIPLFAPVAKHVAVELTEHKRYRSGHMLLFYQVQR
jgi:dihydrofolate reductase